MALIDEIKLRVAVNTANPDLSGLKQFTDAAVKAQQATDRAAKSISSGFGKSNQVLMDMGRIIQDAPYGFGGIANNVQPLVESFTRAKNEAGGVKGAIGGVIASLASPAGLAMVGIPLVTSLAAAFGGKLFDAIGNSKDALDEFGRKLDAVSGYRDISLDVSVIGMSALDKLEVKLTNIESRLSLAKEEAEFQERREKLPPIILSKAQDVLSGALYGNLATKSAGTIARENLEREQKAKYAGYGREIATGIFAAQKGDYSKLKTYRTRDKKLLQAAGYSESMSMSLASQLKILADKAGALAEKHSELGKSHDKLIKDGESAAEKAARLAETAAKQAEDDAIKEGEAISNSIAIYQKATEQLKGEYAAREKYNEVESAAYKLASLGIITEQQATDAALDARMAYEETVDTALGFGNALTDAGKSAERFSAQIEAAGQLAGMLGIDAEGVTGLVSNYSNLSAANTQKLADAKFGGDTGAAQMYTYAGLAQSAGQIIGGKTGSVLSSTASGAMAGTMIAPGIGTIIGGAIGLVSGLFGGSNKEQDRANQEAAQSSAINNSNTVATLAASGSIIAQDLMRRAGYSATNMAGNIGGWGTSTRSYYGAGVDKYLRSNIQDLTLFYTKENNYNKALLDYIQVVSDAEAVTNKFTRSSIATTLDEINWKYEQAIGTAGQLAELDRAYRAELVVGLTGITTDSVTSMLEDIASSTPTGEAGAAFAEKLEASLATSIRSMAEASFAQTILIPALQPQLEAFAQALAAGTDTTQIFSALKFTLNSLVPVVDEFQQSLEALGASSSQISDAIKAQADSLINQGLQVLGNTAALRAIALEDVSPENKALQEILWAQQDAATLVSDTLREFSSSIELLKENLTAEYDSALKLVTNQSEALDASTDRLKTLQSGLHATLNGFLTADKGAASQSAAQKTVSGALNLARAGGSVTLDATLQNALTVISGIQQSDYKSQVEYSRAYYSSMSAVQELSTITDGQVTIAEQQLSALETISETLTNSYNLSVDSLTDLVTAAQNQAAATLAATGTTDAQKEIFGAALDFAETSANVQLDMFGKISDAITGVGTATTQLATVYDTLSLIDQYGAISTAVGNVQGSVDRYGGYNYDEVKKLATPEKLKEATDTVTKLGDINTGITGTDGTNTVLETINRYQTTYENSAAELKATSEVNISVATMNATLATLSANLTAYDSTMYGIMSSISSKYSAEESAKKVQAALDAENARLAAEAAAAKLRETKIISFADGTSSVYGVNAAAPNATTLYAWYNPITGDYFYGIDPNQVPYSCYEVQSSVGYVLPAGAAGSDFDVHKYVNSVGDTELVGTAKATELNLLGQGYVDKGVVFASAKPSGYPVPGYATGGVATGLFVAGEQGAELIDVGNNSARIFNNSQSQKMLDNTRVVELLEKVLEELEVGNFAIAKNTLKTSQYIEKWEKTGLPKETV